MGGNSGAIGLQKADGADEELFFVTTAELAMIEDLFAGAVEE